MPACSLRGEMDSYWSVTDFGLEVLDDFAVCFFSTVHRSCRTNLRCIWVSVGRHQSLVETPKKINCYSIRPSNCYFSWLDPNSEIILNMVNMTHFLNVWKFRKRQFWRWLQGSSICSSFSGAPLLHCGNHDQMPWITGHCPWYPVFASCTGTRLIHSIEVRSIWRWSLEARSGFVKIEIDSVGIVTLTPTWSFSGSFSAFP